MYDTQGKLKNCWTCRELICKCPRGIGAPLKESDEKHIGTAPLIICGHPISYGQLSAPCTLPKGHPTGPHESKPQDWEDGLKEALAAPNDAKHWYDYQRRVFDEIRSLLDSRYQEGVKARMSECCDKCGDFDENGQHAHHVHCKPKNIDSSTNSVV